jgi:hypothetical protein
MNSFDGGDPVTFYDFNLKLCVVEELMYQKSILQPVFDVNQFARSHSERRIDVEQEGFDIIPECKQFFEAMILSEGIVDQVEELTLHLAGSTVTHHIYPFWDGEDDVFNVHASEDIWLLRNLRVVYECDVLENADKAILWVLASCWGRGMLEAHQHHATPSFKPPAAQQHSSFATRSSTWIGDQERVRSNGNNHEDSRFERAAPETLASV